MYSLFCSICSLFVFFFFFQAEDGIRDVAVTGFRRVLFRSRSGPMSGALRIAPPVADAPRPATLTQRASLNVIASILDYGAKVAVGLVVVPILVGGLGRSLYGVWEMLGRLVGYMTAGDGRPTQAL